MVFLLHKTSRLCGFFSLAFRQHSAHFTVYYMVYSFHGYYTYLMFISNKAVNVNRNFFFFCFSLAIMLSGSYVENVIGDFRIACNADRS